MTCPYVRVTFWVLPQVSTLSELRLNWTEDLHWAPSIELVKVQSEGYMSCYLVHCRAGWFALSSQPSENLIIRSNQSIPRAPLPAPFWAPIRNFYSLGVGRCTLIWFVFSAWDHWEQNKIKPCSCQSHQGSFHCQFPILWRGLINVPPEDISNLNISAAPLWNYYYYYLPLLDHCRCIESLRLN